VLGVVAEHPAAEHEALAERAAIQPRRATRAETLARQPERVTDRGSEQQADDSIHARDEARDVPGRDRGFSCSEEARDAGLSRGPRSVVPIWLARVAGHLPARRDRHLRERAAVVASFAAVKKHQVPVEYLVFPDEGHGFVKQDNQIKAQEAYLRFLDKHLRGK
jgi:acetyl esterase/lipase